jgi:hypothetical protein
MSIPGEPQLMAVRPGIRNAPPVKICRDKLSTD